MTDVSRETEHSLQDVEDTPIAAAAATAVRVLSGQAGTLPRPATTRVLTVANQKGGVGKTTTTVNVAAALALHGLRTLVIDLDPQGNASTALGLPHHAGTPSVYEVLVDGASLADVVQPVEGFPDLQGVPATIDLAGAEIELVSLVARETRLHRALGAYLTSEEQAGRAYDYVFVDCPPSLGLLTVNALVAAREVLIPIQAEYYALEGLGQLLRSIELVRAHLNPELRRLDDPADDVRRAHPAGRPGCRRGAYPLPGAGPGDLDPSLRPSLGSTQLRADRDDLRSGVHAGRCPTSRRPASWLGPASTGPRRSA